jgi:hypothetical protein
VSEFYESRQFVGMDLHRRRSVLVRMRETGEHLETVRILNDRDVLADVMSPAGSPPCTRASNWAPAPTRRTPRPATLHVDVRAVDVEPGPAAYTARKVPRRE